MKKHVLILFAAVMAASMSLNARTVLIDEGFENGIQSDVWTQDFVVGNTPWAVEDIADGLSYPATVKQGSKRAYLRNNTGETQGYVTRLVSKVMDLRPTKVYMPELSFWYANPKWGADRDTLRVLYRTGSHSAWKQLAEFGTASSNWQRVKLSLPEVNSTYQIAFEGTDNLGHGIVLDSVKLQSAPECTIPYDIVATNKGAGKVNIAWTASYDADFYELVVSRDTIDPDTVSTVLPDRIAFHGLISDVTNHDLSLESGEFYLVYVRSVCEDENSAWSSEAAAEGPFGFWVRNALQIPFTNDFNSLAGLPDPTRDPEWTWGSNTNNPNPYVNTKTTSAKTRGYYSPDATPAVIFSGGSTSSPSTFIPADRYVYLASPALADTTAESFSINQCQVHFWSTVYTNTGRQYGSSLMVGVMTDPEDITTFVPVDTVTVWNNKTFVENIVDLGSYTGNGSYLAFVSDFDRENLFYIDNVSVEYRKTINKVTKINVNPRDTYATITWEGNASSYDVLITKSEVNPSNPTASAIVDQATVTTNSYLCEVLEADHSWNRPYYVYVKAAGTDWSYRYPFVTIAAKRAIPYSYDFEAQTPVYNIESGDQTVYAVGLGVFGNSGAYPAVESKSSKSYAGSGYLYLNKRGGTDAWFTLPMVDNLDSVQVKFYLSGSDTYMQAHATIGIMSNPMDINTFVPVSSFKLNTTGYTRCYANFENYHGPDGVIAIVWDDVMNMTQNTINYIDELTVEELSECVPPTDLDLEIAPDSVTVRWQGALSDEWEFFLSRAALSESQRMHKTLEEIAAMGGVVVAQTLEWNNPSSNPVFGFGNLIPHTTYYLYIRATCDRDWWTEMAFTTPCRAETFPYKETFENYNVNSTVAGCWQLADYMGVGYPKIYQAGSTTASNKTLELYSSGTIHRTMAILPEVEGSLSSMLLSLDARTYEGTSSAEGILYIGTMGDIYNVNSFVPFDTVYIKGGSEYTKIRIDLANVDLRYDNIAITTGLGALAMNSHVIIDNVALKDPGCIEAYDYEQIGAEPNSIDLTWNGLSTNDRWEVKVLTVNVAISAVKNGMYNPTYAFINDTIITGKLLHVDGMKPKRNYYVYVRALCGDSTWTTTPVYTSCDYIDPNQPNKETFDTYGSGTGTAPECWIGGNGNTSIASTSSYMPYIYSSSTYSSSGSYTYRMYGYYSSSTSNYTPAYVVAPGIKCTSLKDIAVTFNMYASTSYSWLLGVMTDPYDLSTFVVIDSVQGTGSSVQYTYELSDYENIIPATAKYVAWRTPYGKTSYAYLDDVSFVSTACPLTKPSVSEVTTSSARISSGIRTGDQWILIITNKEISEEDFARPNYVVPSSWVVYRDTTDRRSIEVHNLAAQTKYYVATAALCDSIMSQWRIISFTTPCEAHNPEDLGTITFSTEEGYGTGSGSEMPCWTVGSKTQNASASYIPYVERTSSTMHNGNGYLKLYDYVSGTSSVYVGAYAIMPELAVDSIAKYQINFWGRSNSSSSYNNQVIVGVITDPSDLNTFVAIDTLNLSRSAWDPYTVSFENYMGDYMGDMGRNIMFLSDFGVTNYAYISEISMELIPRCRPISSFSVDSVGESTALVTWKGYQNSYRVLLSDKVLEDNEKADYMYLVDTVVNGNEIFLTDLLPSTNYYVYAQGICGNGDSTAISMVYASIRTTCPTETGVPAPFFDDFDAYSTGSGSPGCWIFRNDGSTSYPQIQSVSSTGTQAVELYTTSSHHSWIVMPLVDGSLQDMLLSFDARAWSSSFTGTLYVGTIADPEDPATFVQIAQYPQTNPNAFTHYEMNLADYDLTYNYIAFTSGLASMGLSSSSDLYLDNVSLSYLTTCNAPRLKSAGIQFNSIEVNITPAKAEDTRWELVIIPESTYSRISNINAYLNSASKILATSKHVVFSGLEAATSYYIFARTLCVDEGSESTWMRTPLKVHTQFYYADNYFFGFEKTGELWERSLYSESDNYYLHPALIAGRDSAAVPSQSFIDYPHSRENTESQLYSRTDNGAMLMYSAGGSHGEYIIFPPVEEPHDRSFEFKVRSGYLSAEKYPQSSFDAILEIGTIDKNTTFDSYQPLAMLRLDKLNPSVQAKSKNNMLYSNYTLDLDSATVASKQLVFHMPKQPSDTSYVLVDDVTMGESKGFSLVALDKVIVGGNTATVQWQNIGGPWNLYIRDAGGNTIQEFLNLTNVTSQVVEDLEPRTDYSVLLEAAGVNGGSYVTSDKLAFRTLCQVLEPSTFGHDFLWDFDNAYDWEANDVLAGDAYDSLYYKPGCFKTDITYNTPVNGYQWLVQRKGYEYVGAQTGYSASRHYETGRDDSQALRISTTAANYNSYIVLPELNCGFDTMMIEFYGRCFANYDAQHASTASRGKIVDAQYLGTSYSQSIVVGTLTDPNDLSTLHVLDTLTYSHTHLTTGDNVADDPAGLRYWELMQLPLDEAQGKYVVLFQPAPGLFFIDDLRVKPTRGTLFKPSNTHTTDITATSARLSWTVRHPEMSTVVVVLNAMGTQEILRDTVAGTTYQVDNLQSAMMYQWYVYQTDMQRNSPSSKPVSFATECVTVSPDYTCGFEMEEGWKNIEGQTAYKQMLCWTYSDAINNEWTSATYDPYNQANTSYARYSHSGDQALMMRAIYNARGTSYQPYVVLPAMNVAAFDTLQVKFWMRPAYVNASTGAVATSYTASNYSKSVIVGTMTDPNDATTFVPLDTVTYDGTLSTSDVATEANNYLYQQMKVELVGGTGPYVAFMTSFAEKGGKTQKSGDYIWIDDIFFEHKQECKDPTGLQALIVGAEHAILTWNSIDSAATYLLQVSTDPYFVDEDAFAFNNEVNSNTCTVEGLRPMTSYVWRVQALCGEKWGESSFTPRETFKTVRSPFFLEEFNTNVSSNEWLFSKTHADVVVDSTSLISRGVDNWSFIRTATSYGLEGSHYVAPGYSGDYHWMITPVFYLPEKDSVHFSMDLALTALNSAHAVTGNAVTENDMRNDYYFMIIVSEDGGETWKSENILAKWQNTNPEGKQLRDIATYGQTVRYSLAKYAGKNIRIGLYREAKTTSTTGIAIHVDNVRLGYFEKTVEGASACQYEDIQIGDITLSGDETTPGIHSFPICFYKSAAEAQAGARDSVHALEIEIYPVQEVEVSDTICEGDTYTSYDFQPKDRGGVYRRKLQTLEHGCDSIVTLYLYAKPRAYAPDEEVALCPGEVYRWNGNIYNRAGIFRDTLVSAIGCDSIETLVVSYFKQEDTLHLSSRVLQNELPFTFESDNYPYAVGQAPIYYSVGTPVGRYIDTVLVQGENCNRVLVHTLIISSSQDIDEINAEDGRGARKVLYRDNLYIILDDEWYNAEGKKVGNQLN